VMMRLGRVYKGLMIDMRVTNRKLRGRAIQMICEIAEVDSSIAETALERAGDAIKLAVLIAMGEPPEKGTALLEASGGNLRTAIEQCKPSKP
jgi:N-acetylmuramic acid 6-phosphate etherase